MEEKKKGKSWIAILILSILLVVSLGLLAYTNKDKFMKDDNEKQAEKKDNKENKPDELFIENVEITNSEIKELYNYVEPSVDFVTASCLGFFYDCPFKNYTLDDKVSLVLFNYASKYEKDMDDKLLQKISGSDREYIKEYKASYVEANTVREGMKLLFNIDVQKFNVNTDYHSWSYRSDCDAFFPSYGGGTMDITIFQQIIDYNELDGEINLTVVKAEIDSDNNVYRTASNKKTLVVKNDSDNFKFTKENVNKFPQLKYVFKKNSNGRYYVSDIINLNFEEDFLELN